MFGPRFETFLKMMLTSDQPGEMINARDFLMRELKTAGLDVHAFSQQVVSGGGNGKISEADMNRLYKAAYAAGYRDALRAADRQPGREMSDPDRISWKDAAEFCRASPLFTRGGLKTAEMDFINDMARKMGFGKYRTPTLKQASWLTDLYMRCGGKDTIE